MSVKTFFSGLKSENFDYQNPDFNNMGSWPAAVKVLTLLLVVLLTVFLIFWFFIKESNRQYERAVSEEPRLKEQYRTKSFQVANLDAFKLQLMEMEDTFGALLAQLPDETEMPGLIDDISTTGTQSGLEIDKITPAADVNQEFYIETPISIEVRGSYHEMGNFISSMSAIPRIVTLHDYSINVVGRSDVSEGDAPLSMTIQAKTYRYKGDDQ